MSKKRKEKNEKQEVKYRKIPKKVVKNKKFTKKFHHHFPSTYNFNIHKTTSNNIFQCFSSNSACANNQNFAAHFFCVGLTGEAKTTTLLLSIHVLLCMKFFLDTTNF